MLSIPVFFQVYDCSLHLKVRGDDSVMVLAKSLASAGQILANWQMLDKFMTCTRQMRGKCLQMLRMLDSRMVNARQVLSICRADTGPVLGRCCASDIPLGKQLPAREGASCTGLAMQRTTTVL